MKMYIPRVSKGPKIKASRVSIKSARTPKISMKTKFASFKGGKK